MQSDGSVIIDTKILDGGLEKGFEVIRDQMETVGVTAEKTGEQIKLSFSQMDVSKTIAAAADQVKTLEEKLASVSREAISATKYGSDEEAARLGAQRAQVYDQLEAARKKLYREIVETARKEAAAEEKEAKRITEAKQREAEKQQRAAMKPLRRFGNRLQSIVSGALVFNLLSAGLRTMTQYFGNALKSNQQFTASFAKLKGALLTAFQPIYEVVVPALVTLMNILTSVVQAVGHIFTLLAGKSDQQMAENAEAINKQTEAISGAGGAAKKAAKQLAKFDEIQKLSAQTESGGGGGSGGISADFGGFNTEDYKAKIDEITTYVSMSLLALGAILAFSGANIPLGIGLMALGAVGLAAEIATNWNAVKRALSGSVGKVTAIISGAFLALGAILAFSGANIPLGIGLMTVGAIGLATTIAANWDTIKEKLRGPVGEVVAFISAALLALGAILVFTGAALPLGIGLMVAGAAGLATTAALNWDIVKGKIKNVLAGILSILSGASLVLGVLLCLSGAGLGLGLALIFAGLKGTEAAWSISDNPVTRWVKNLVDTITGIVTSGITAIYNALSQKKTITVREAALGSLGGASNIRSIVTPEVPALARGAVIPPNAPFMAMLGDQRHGTNIEAPLSTIQEAVALVMEDYAAANLAGHEATVAVLREILEAVLGIEIGDDALGKAVSRYNARLATMRGDG